MSLSIEQIAAEFPNLSLLTGEDSRARPLFFGSQAPNPAKGIARPRNTEELAALVKFCHAHDQVIITGGGLTNLVQATKATEDDLIISTELMTHVEEVSPEDRTMIVQSGATLQSVHEAAERHGLAMEADLGARGSATIGGMISTNAGGNRVVRYGMMREQVLGLEVVLADGTVMSSLNRVLKNNAGYDLKHMFIGAEGTLGIITRAVLRLREEPPHITTLFLAVPSYEAVCQLLRHFDSGTSGTLSTFEVMWQDFYKIMTTEPAPHTAPLSQNHPFYILLELTGKDHERTEALAMELIEDATEKGLITDGLIAKNDAERQKLWAIRDDIPQLFQLWPMKTFDISVPLSHMQQYIDEMKAALDKELPNNRTVIFGHLGDSNIHVIVGAGTDDESVLPRIEELVYAPLPKVHGTISAEHGIGLEKKAFLSLSRTPEELMLMKQLKNTLDPKNLLNPGKIIAA